MRRNQNIFVKPIHLCFPRLESANFQPNVPIAPSLHLDNAIVVKCRDPPNHEPLKSN